MVVLGIQGQMLSLNLGGSDLMWIQCDASCTSCPSDDCHQCDYEIEYADHSSSFGVLAKDELQLVLANGTGTKSNFVFGCAYDQQGTLLNALASTDGILGLSRAPISLPFQLANHGLINSVIGHCLGTDINGGYLFLGNDFVPHWRMSWVPMLNIPFPNLYQAELMKMNYGGKELRLGSKRDGQGTVVFDSGSTYTYFTDQAYKALISMLEEIFSEDLVKDASDTTLSICWRAKFPVRSITELSIPAEGYLTINEKGNVCLGILDGSNIHDGSAIILGDISLRGQLFVYDNVNQKIGWIRSNCERPQKLSSLPFF
ncbi:hypothetical protein K7X08_004030 [Anisodus acutangulus]|uniref:Peptidase A1 domain-containing protein n=1 Tax=Anisodus acutangulus TaxID=402998 RepID=A0A9Q1MGH5_9SOLA|nr:hypothetical protein K7X08_004030 [Anisodus acutangulus]